jgi:hypothetical protein
MTAAPRPPGVRAPGVLLACLLATAPGCLTTEYLLQAAHGQANLLSRARPIDQVVRDRRTPVRVAALLAEIPAIKTYGRSYGLTINRNYSTYAALGRPAAVWFVGAADPLAFKPLQWCFPIAGCFAGLGWFDEDDGVRHKLALDAQGYDTLIRPASAYSSGSARARRRTWRGRSARRSGCRSSPACSTPTSSSRRSTTAAPRAPTSSPPRRGSSTSWSPTSTCAAGPTTPRSPRPGSTTAAPRRWRTPTRRVAMCAAWCSRARP